MAIQRGYERVAVTRPADANYGAIRARMPAAIAEMRRLRAAGVPVATISEQFGISLRTAYRYLVDADYVDIAVAGWTATFAVSPGKPPWRVSPWRPG
jgi:hypothetical protein